MRKLVIICLLMASGAAQAALRGQAGDAITTNQTSISVDVSAIGIQSGDVILIFIEVGGTGQTFTWPAGFSAVPGLTNLDIVGNPDHVTAGVAYKIAGASEPTSYSVSYASNYASMRVRVYSGRNTSAPFAAVAQTNNTAMSGASPAPFSLTGLTAVAGDDIVGAVAIANEDPITTGSINAPTGYTNTAFDFSTAALYSLPLGSFDDVNAASGATGTLAGSLTYTTTFGQPPSNYGGYVIALAPASGSTCTHSGWNIDTGAFSVPTAGTGSFWLQSGAKGATDCSTTKYWQSGGVFGAN